MIEVMMGMVGIEPTLPFGNGFLRPARLPVPPRPRVRFQTAPDYKDRSRDGQASIILEAQRGLRAFAFLLYDHLQEVQFPDLQLEFAAGRCLNFRHDIAEALAVELDPALRNQSPRLRL